MAEVNLFIEDSAIKLIVNKDRRVEKWAKLPLEPGLVNDGLIISETEVATKIRELFKLQKVSARTVVAALSGINSVYRLITLPELPAAILPEAVEQEASRVVPVPMDQVYLSYQQLPSTEGETLVFLAAFPRNATDALLRTLQQAGLRADVLDLAPLALCRTVDAPEAVIVDVSAAGLDIAIMKERIPQVIRSISLPGEAQSLSERLPAIVEEFNRTIAFYNSSHRDNPVSASIPIFVSGDLAQAPESWQQFSGKEGYSVSALPSPMQLLEGFDYSQFMVNIGLALKQLPVDQGAVSFSIVNINALPHAEKPKRKVSPVGVLLPIIIILGIGGIFYMFNLGRNIESNNELLRSQIATMQSQIPEQQAVRANLDEQLADIEPQVEPMKAAAAAFNLTFAELQDGTSRIEHEVTQIANLTPEEIALRYGGEEIIGYTTPISEGTIDHVGEIATIGGKTQDLDSIFQYARDLGASGGFSRVTVSSITAYQEIVESEEGDGEETPILGYNFKLILER